MTSIEQVLTRELNPREKHRYLTHGILPVDAVSPLCFTRELRTKILYRYGCGLEEMNLEIEDNGSIEKQNPIFHLRGFHSFFVH